MLERVAEVFRGQQAKGRFPGGQLVIRHKGREVLSVAVGVARGFRESEGIAPIAVTTQTRFSVFSASKAVVALAVAMLEDRGVLDVAAPVARYVPDFAANGKSELTVLDVLTHRAGVLTPELDANPRDWPHEDRSSRRRRGGRGARSRTCPTSTGGFWPRSSARPRAGDSTTSCVTRLRAPRRSPGCVSARRTTSFQFSRERTGSARAG